MSSALSCKYFIAKTFAHTAAGVGIAAASAQYPMFFELLKRELGGPLWAALLTGLTSE